MQTPAPKFSVIRVVVKAVLAQSGFEIVNLADAERQRCRDEARFQMLERRVDELERSKRTIN